MKIALLATDGITSAMVLKTLVADFGDISVGIEKPISRWLLLRNRIKKLGFLQVFGQLLFMLLMPILSLEAKQRIIELLEPFSVSRLGDIVDNSICFSSVNSPECRAWLAELDPDIVVVNGTRIISEQTLKSCAAVFINVHCGITPAYRGVHGGYWALVMNDRLNMGATVHIVDPGIDTGGIVYQSNISIDRMDNFVTYPIRQYIAALPFLVQAIRDISTGNLQIKTRSDLPSRLWHHPTLWGYIYRRLFKAIR